MKLKAVDYVFLTLFLFSVTLNIMEFFATEDIVQAYHVGLWNRYTYFSADGDSLIAKEKLLEILRKRDENAIIFPDLDNASSNDDSTLSRTWKILSVGPYAWTTVKDSTTAQDIIARGRYINDEGLVTMKVLKQGEETELKIGKLPQRSLISLLSAFPIFPLSLMIWILANGAKSRLVKVSAYFIMLYTITRSLPYAFVYHHMLWISKLNSDFLGYLIIGGIFIPFIVSVKRYGRAISVCLVIIAITGVFLDMYWITSASMLAIILIPFFSERNLHLRYYKRILYYSMLFLFLGLCIFAVHSGRYIPYIRSLLSMSFVDPKMPIFEIKYFHSNLGMLNGLAMMYTFVVLIYMALIKRFRINVDVAEFVVYASAIAAFTILLEPVFFGIGIWIVNKYLVAYAILVISVIISALIARRVLRMLPFVNPVRFSPSSMNLRFLKESFKYHDLKEYVDFTLKFFTNLDHQYQLAFLSDHYRAGYEFQDLSKERKDLLYNILKDDLQYLNIDMEILNETEYSESLAEFYKADLPRLVYPIRNETKETIALLAFGKMPGVYWHSKLANALGKIARTFESFYLSMLHNKEAEEKETQLVRAEEARKYQEQIAKLEQIKNGELEAKNKRITDSINYASLIQQSMLPPDTLLSEAFPRHFMIWKPRDIVGGDFYWLYRNSFDDSTYFAVIDCTGHGVPGALMSFAANAQLEQIVGIKHIYEPKDILWELHQSIGSTLHQSMENNIQDGMDITLIKTQKGKIYFAGAKQSLYLYSFQDKSVTRFRGDKQSVGGLKWVNHNGFMQQEIAYSGNIALYLASDGLLDQPSENGRRLNNQSWQSMLLGIAELSLAEQKQYLESYLEKILTHDEQRDDITIAGIQFFSGL